MPDVTDEPNHNSKPQSGTAATNGRLLAALVQFVNIASSTGAAPPLSAIRQRTGTSGRSLHYPSLLSTTRVNR